MCDRPHTWINQVENLPEYPAVGLWRGQLGMCQCEVISIRSDMTDDGGKIVLEVVEQRLYGRGQGPEQRAGKERAQARLWLRCTLNDHVLSRGEPVVGEIKRPWDSTVSEYVV
jgi:hypothetical protein